MSIWRPHGTQEQELGAYFLGRVPALNSHEVLYESAWKERCKLVTVATGKVYVEVFVLNRFFSKHSIDG